MPPRTILCVLAFAVPVFAVFCLGVLLLAILIAYYRGTAIDDTGTVTLACCCSLIAGLFFLVFHVKHETAILPLKDRKIFLADCRAVLGDLGYEVDVLPGDRLVSRPSFRALLLGGRLHVDASGEDARLSGPKVFVEIVRGKLRLNSHLARVEKSWRDSRCRQGDRLLKRLQISLRVSPQQWGAVSQGVLAELTAAGAQVVCQVDMMAHSDNGIRESLIDGRLREWFRRENLQANIHKDHVRWDEPVAVGEEVCCGTAS
jgi:hypothetical protein